MVQMSLDDDHGIEFARAALARARSHARTSTRPGVQRRVRTRPRWGQEPDEAVYSGARADGRDPMSLGVALADVVASQGWAESLTVATVTSRWQSIVGPDVAEHTEVETFEVTVGDGVSPTSVINARVVVRADSTAWATQLRLLLPALRRRLVEELAAVTGLVAPKSPRPWNVDIKVLAPSAPSWRHGSRHVSGRGPRDTYG